MARPQDFSPGTGFTRRPGTAAGREPGMRRATDPRSERQQSEEAERELAKVIDEVRHIEVQSLRLATELLAGGYSSVFRGAGIEFDEVREYVEGDDPRTVDWNVTARAGRPFVKKYVDERELTVIFALDISPSMSGGFGIWSARQTAARVCACLALAAQKNNDRVGLITFSDDVDGYLPPGKGTSHVLRIVRDCLALPPGGRHSDFAPALEFAGGVLRRRSILFLISDFLATGWEAQVALAARRHDLIAVRLLLPEFVPPEVGLLRLRDPESSRETVIDWRDARTRATYLRRVAAWKTGTEEALSRAGVDRMDVPVPAQPDRDAVARPILELFRMRRRRGAGR